MKDAQPEQPCLGRQRCPLLRPLQAGSVPNPTARSLGHALRPTLQATPTWGARKPATLHELTTTEPNCSPSSARCTAAGWAASVEGCTSTVQDRLPHRSRLAAGTAASKKRSARLPPAAPPVGTCAAEGQGGRWAHELAIRRLLIGGACTRLQEGAMARGLTSHAAPQPALLPAPLLPRPVCSPPHLGKREHRRKGLHSECILLSGVGRPGRQLVHCGAGNGSSHLPVRPGLAACMCARVHAWLHSAAGCGREQPRQPADRLAEGGQATGAHPGKAAARRRQHPARQVAP